MTVIGFPTPDKDAFVKPKTLEDWPWDNELGKPYTDINSSEGMAYSSDEQLLDLARFKEGSPATEILKKASGLIDGERNVQHGDRKECHTLIARLWTAYLGVQVTATEVACMMALLKIARTKSGSFNGDCYVDGAGYMALAGELANDSGC